MFEIILSIVPALINVGVSHGSMCFNMRIPAGDAVWCIQPEMRLYGCSKQNTGSKHLPEFGFLRFVFWLVDFPLFCLCFRQGLLVWEF